MDDLIPLQNFDSVDFEEVEAALIEFETPELDD